MLDLAISVSPLVLDDVVRFHDIMTNIILPLSEKLDPVKNPASKWGSRALDECKKPDPDGRPIIGNIIRAMANYWIYCDLFHHTIYNTFMRPSPLLPQLSVTTRRKWLALCVPDCNDESVSNPRDGDQLDMHELYGTFPEEKFIAPAYKAGRYHCRDFLVYMESAGLETFRLCLMEQVRRRIKIRVH